MCERLTTIHSTEPAIEYSRETFLYQLSLRWVNSPGWWNMFLFLVVVFFGSSLDHAQWDWFSSLNWSKSTDAIFDSSRDVKYQKLDQINDACLFCSLRLAVSYNTPSFCKDWFSLVQEKPFFTQISTLFFFSFCHVRTEAKSRINRDNPSSQQSIDLQWRAPPAGTVRYFTVSLWRGDLHFILPGCQLSVHTLVAGVSAVSLDTLGKRWSSGIG